MTSMSYTGAWPVATTPFNDDGTLDLPGMRRVLDCIADQGADGICILANFSEQFLIADDERETLTRLCLEHIAGRVPVIVTISHYATQIAVARARLAKDLGASAVMMMSYVSEITTPFSCRLRLRLRSSRQKWCCRLTSPIKSSTIL